MYYSPNDLLRDLLDCDDLDSVITKIHDAVTFRPFVIEKEGRPTRWGIGNALGDTWFRTYETEDEAQQASQEATNRWHMRGKVNDD